MSETERVINDLNVAKHILCNPQMLTFEMNIKIGQAITNALALLKRQEKRIKELEEKLMLLEYGDQDILENGMMPAT